MITLETVAEARRERREYLSVRVPQLECLKTCAEIAIRREDFPTVRRIARELMGFKHPYNFQVRGQMLLWEPASGQRED